jgi:hypothetical protein
MKSAGPLLQITAYYFAISLLLNGWVKIFPTLVDYLLLGGNELSLNRANAFLTGTLTTLSWDSHDKTIKLAQSTIGALLIMKPVAWIYGVARPQKKSRPGLPADVTSTTSGRWRNW